MRLSVLFYGFHLRASASERIEIGACFGEAVLTKFLVGTNRCLIDSDRTAMFAVGIQLLVPCIYLDFSRQIA